MNIKLFLPIVTFLAVMLCFGNFATAQKVHLVAYGDTNLERQLAGIELDVNNIRTFLKGGIAPDKFVDHTSELKPEDCTPNKIKQFLANLYVTRDDVVVFYYTGHGAQDRNSKKRYFTFADRSGQMNHLLEEDVEKAIKTNNPKLTVILGDCCSFYGNYKESSRSVGDEALQNDGTTKPLFDKLFFRSVGTVSLTAAEDFEVAMGTADGGIFTRSLIDVIKKNQDSNSLSWKDVYAQTRDTTNALFKKIWPDGYKIEELGVTLRKQIPQMLSKNGTFGAKAKNNNSEGVTIVELLSGYPAEKNGFERGDVILEINGRKISSIKDYTESIDSLDSNKTSVKMKVRNGRDGSTQTHSIEMMSP